MCENKMNPIANYIVCEKDCNEFLSYVFPRSDENGDAAAEKQD